MKNKAIALLCAGALLVGSSASAAGLSARRVVVQSPISQSVTYQSKSLQQIYFQLLNKKVPCNSGSNAGSQKPGSGSNAGSQNPGSGSNTGSQKPGSGSNTGSQNPGSGSNTGTQKPGSGSSSNTGSNTGSAAQQPSDADSVRNQILQLVNQARAEAGLQPLRTTSALNSAAQTRAQELSQVYSHNRPDGSSCFTVLGEKGISYRSAGENIAIGYKTAQQVFNAWMNSEGHRKNILSEKFTHIGIGYTAQQGWTQLFIAQ